MIVPSSHHFLNKFQGIDLVRNVHPCFANWGFPSKFWHMQSRIWYYHQRFSCIKLWLYQNCCKALTWTNWPVNLNMIILRASLAHPMISWHQCKPSHLQYVQIPLEKIKYIKWTKSLEIDKLRKAQTKFSNKNNALIKNFWNCIHQKLGEKCVKCYDLFNFNVTNNYRNKDLLSVFIDLNKVWKITILLTQKNR